MTFSRKLTKVENRTKGFGPSGKFIRIIFLISGKNYQMLGSEEGSLAVKGHRVLTGSVGSGVHRSLVVKGPQGLSGSVGWVHQLLEP